MPNGSATTVATSRDPQRQRDGGPFLGGKFEHASATTPAWIKKLKPYFSKIALAARRAQEVEIARDRRLGVAAVAATG